MLVRWWPRHFSRRLIRAIVLCILLLLLLDLLQTWRALWHREPSLDDPPPIPGTVFLATTLWNSEAVLRDHWTSAVLELANHLGPSRLYVSIYESGSWDDTKAELGKLEAGLARLHIPRTVVTNDSTHADQVSRPPGVEGWVKTARGTWEPRRIPYLAWVRNASLRPLQELGRQGIFFDWILFLNDVVFTVGDLFPLSSCCRDVEVEVLTREVAGTRSSTSV